MLLGKAAVVCAYVQRVSVSGRVVCAVKQIFLICMCFFFHLQHVELSGPPYITPSETPSL